MRDDEVYGEGNAYEFEYRIYDPRIGKFLSVDPLTADFPWYTPYQFSGNRPIWCIDLDGREDEVYSKKMQESVGTSVLEVSNMTTVGKEFHKALKAQNKIDVVYYTYDTGPGDYRGSTRHIKSWKDFNDFKNKNPHGKNNDDITGNDVKKSLQSKKSVLLIGIKLTYLNAVERGIKKDDESLIREFGAESAEIIDHEKNAHGIDALLRQWNILFVGSKGTVLPCI